MSPRILPPSRAALRARLVAARQAWLQRAEDREAAESGLATALGEVLQQLDPTVLGSYWPIKGEFNPSSVLCGDAPAPRWPLALPFARRSPPAMHYRHWDGRAPALRDECAIPASDGDEVVPDVVLVPCVGFTREGFRLGYGGGYFDRWIAAHPGVTAVGVAWALSEIDGAQFDPESHDRPLDVVVTEHGVVV